MGVFIVYTLRTDNQNYFSEFKNLILVWISKPLTFIALTLFSIFNWYFESEKWKILVKNIQNISTLNAVKQVLTSHSVSIITPFKSGDYVFKPLFYPLKYKWKIIALNGLGNLAQLLITTLMGFLGILIIVFVHPANFPNEMIKANMVLLLVFVLTIPVFYAFSITERFKTWKENVQLISKKKLKEVLGLSLIRYLIFSHQYYFLLFLSDVPLSYIQSISLIFIMYLVSSYLGVMNLFDFIIKGSIGIWLFSFFDINNQLIFSISVVMWGLNFLFPALTGYVILLFSKKEWFNIKPINN